MKTYRELVTNESKSDNAKIEKLIKQLDEAQEKMIDLKSDFRSAYREMKSLPGPIAERFYRYFLGHFEPLVDKNHEWLTKGDSLEDFKKQLEEHIVDEE